MRARDLLGQIITTLLDRFGPMHLIASRDVRTIELDGVRITITVHIEPVKGLAWNDTSSRLSLRSSPAKRETSTGD
jgi:hypothetical protein